MLEALILWQLVSSRNESRAQRGQPAPGTDFFVGLLWVSFLITMFIWPVNAVYRAKLLGKRKPIGIALASITVIFVGLGAPEAYFVIGFFWACGELANCMDKAERGAR